MKREKILIPSIKLKYPFVDSDFYIWVFNIVSQSYILNLENLITCDYDTYLANNCVQFELLGICHVSLPVWFLLFKQDEKIN